MCVELELVLRCWCFEGLCLEACLVVLLTRERSKQYTGL